MAKDLKVPTFQDIPGFRSIAATVNAPGSLSVQVNGTRLFTRAMIQRMLLGPVEASLFGVAIMMRRFVILNDGQPKLVSMTVSYDVQWAENQPGENDEIARR